MAAVGGEMRSRRAGRPEGRGCGGATEGVWWELLSFQCPVAAVAAVAAVIAAARRMTVGCGERRRYSDAPP